MASKAAIKLTAKYNALMIAARVIELHCSGSDFDDLEDLPDGLLDQIDRELESIVTTMKKRATKAKGDLDVPDLIDIALSEI